MTRFLVALTLAALAFAPAHAVSPQEAALAADDECVEGTCALNALQHNAAKTATAKAHGESEAQEESEGEAQVAQMDVHYMMENSEGKIYFQDGADRFRCGAIYCDGANGGSFCCHNSICCYRSKCVRGSTGLPMCVLR